MSWELELPPVMWFPLAPNLPFLSFFPSRPFVLSALPLIPQPGRQGAQTADESQVCPAAALQCGTVSHAFFRDCRPWQVTVVLDRSSHPLPPLTLATEEQTHQLLAVAVTPEMSQVSGSQTP